MNDCLVYFFTGFLDSGKTSVICSWADGDNFNDKKTVIVCTEEGEEEYLKENYENADPIVIHAETDEITKEFTFDIEKKYKPDVIFIEWNGSVSPAKFFDEVDVPRRWALAACVIMIDASTYKLYLRNMQTMFADYFRYGDTVIFNRVDPENDNIPKLRGSVKSINPGMSINFLSKDNEIIRLEDHLPYDLSKNPCDIAADDFGLFYTDSLDNAGRYEGKVVSLIGMATVLREFRGRAFVLARQAFTCCADDVQVMGILCFKEYKSNFPDGQWIKVTGKIKYFQDKRSDGEPIDVPSLEVIDYSLTSAPENEIIYFS
ncbi:MAG: hypothetical protein J5786_04730 [Clostridiales bacterium]|nr:hypothetical protein [Clostridiales bacterium]